MDDFRKGGGGPAEMTRREGLRLAARTGLSALLTVAAPVSMAWAQGRERTRPIRVGAFVYTELQISVPFDKAPWADVNAHIRTQPGFLNKTWLAGLGNGSVGGIYAFDSITHAQRFVTGYFPSEARNFGVAQTTRVFDAKPVEEASRAMNSVYFGGKLERAPGAFVYTELQVNAPFAQAPWRGLNPRLKAQPGLLSKTWLSGVNTNTVGGIYAFDGIENAKAFAVHYFPKEAAEFDSAFYTRIFDASLVVEASRQMNSPFFA